eukprot:4963904-Amphidinium_carterae.1
MIIACVLTHQCKTCCDVAIKPMRSPPPKKALRAADLEPRTSNRGKSHNLFFKCFPSGFYC